jgi:ComF family protein
MMKTARTLVVPGDDAVVIGVPLHRARRRERGYDQARILAEALAAGLELECPDGVLVRRRHSKPQSDLPLDERFRNMEDAFVVRRSTVLEGRTVLLIDDVVTTGITLGSCARALAAAGVRRTIALTFARRILTDEQRGGK